MSPSSALISTIFKHGAKRASYKLARLGEIDDVALSCPTCATAAATSPYDLDSYKAAI